MDAAVQNTLSSRGSKKELEVWRIHKDHLDTVFQNGGPDRGKNACSSNSFELRNHISCLYLFKCVQGDEAGDEAP